MFHGFGNAHRRIAGFEQAGLIAAAAEPIGAIDHLHIQAINVVVGKAVEEARHVAAGRIILAAVVAAAVGLSGAFHGLGAFRKHADMARILHAANAGAVPNDVVVEVGFHHPALGAGVIGQHLAAVQSLLLTRQHGIDDGGGELVQRKHARRFNHGGGAAAIIIGARRIALGIVGIAVAAVDMSGNDDVPVRIGCAALDGQHVHDLGRVGQAITGEHLRGLFNGQAIAAGGAERLKAAFGPAAGGADAAGRAGGVAGRMAGAETHQRGDAGLQLGLAHAGGKRGERRFGSQYGRRARQQSRHCHH